MLPIPIVSQTIWLRDHVMPKHFERTILSQYIVPRKALSQIFEEHKNSPKKSLAPYSKTNINSIKVRNILALAEPALAA